MITLSSVGLKMKFILFIVVLCGEATSFFGEVLTKEVYFTLYTKDKPTEGSPLKVDTVLHDGIKRDIPWKFFAHGWTTSPRVSPWFNLSRDNYFKKGEYNIVYVDWSKPANQTYIRSVLNTQGSGEYFGKFLLNLNRNGVPLDQIHLLGHSLGSHMVGHAARWIYKQTRDKIYRVTATDPAGPLFDMPILVPPKYRVDKADASFVDVVHTDAGNYGMDTSVGHVDFYPNGGKRFQPGCENDNDENCSHGRSVTFYAESILSDSFIAREAKSYEDYLEHKYKSHIEAVFGENVNTSLRGVFYFKTKSGSPFALGNNK